MDLLVLGMQRGEKMHFSLRPRIRTIFTITTLVLGCVILTSAYYFMRTPVESHPAQEPYPSEKRTIIDEETRVVQGPCSSQYQASLVTPNTMSVWWIYFEVTKPDGHTPLCIYGLSDRPTSWKFSPDGQYLFTFTLFDHNWGYDVYQLSTG